MLVASGQAEKITPLSVKDLSVMSPKIFDSLGYLRMSRGKHVGHQKAMLGIQPMEGASTLNKRIDAARSVSQCSWEGFGRHIRRQFVIRGIGHIRQSARSLREEAIRRSLRVQNDVQEWSIKNGLGSPVFRT